MLWMKEKQGMRSSSKSSLARVGTEVRSHRQETLSFSFPPQSQHCKPCRPIQLPPLWARVRCFRVARLLPEVVPDAVEAAAKVEAEVEGVAGLISF